MKDIIRGNRETLQGAEGRDYELFVPMNRRADAVGQQVKALLNNRGRIDVANVGEFLKTLGIALRKLERQARAE